MRGTKKKKKVRKKTSRYCKQTIIILFAPESRDTPACYGTLRAHRRGGGEAGSRPPVPPAVKNVKLLDPFGTSVRAAPRRARSRAGSDAF